MDCDAVSHATIVCQACWRTRLEGQDDQEAFAQLRKDAEARYPDANWTGKSAHAEEKTGRKAKKV